ncbi:MAG: ubiquinol-cytochrome C chaperone family protein [Xanthobacteraceae bacterium]|jgi:cytochrome b pre-mRNA-processing protein 3
MILPAFRRGHHNRNIHALYGAIVAQARSAVFYTRYGVPDTVEGRFELIVLHLVLILGRLGRGNGAVPGPGSKRSSGLTIGQRLFDVFCRDLDDNLREMGVGDLAVPREMRRFGEAFYGRQGAYGAALAATDERELEKALARNIFGVTGVDERAARLARYARATAQQLDTEAEDALVAGKTLVGNAVFPSPEAFAHA